MLDRKRLDPFSPKDMVESHADLEEAGYDQRAALLLREMRLQAGLSVRQLADQLHRSAEEVDKLERGQSLESPTMSLMFQIAGICQATVVFRIGRQQITV
jgi:ribosome-binding protein aMBF1 (putative translation factor)